MDLLFRVHSSSADRNSGWLFSELWCFSCRFTGQCIWKSVLLLWHIASKVVSGATPKFSFHVTPYSIIRPELLGSNVFQQTIKDYNGQTYWLSLDLNRILNANVLPGWLMLTIGYGAEGLLGGHDNVWSTKEGEPKDYSSVARTKRIFISVDVNANYLREKNRWLNYLFAPFVFIRFPSPAIEFNFERGIIFHPVYF